MLLTVLYVPPELGADLTEIEALFGNVCEQNGCQAVHKSYN